MWLLALLPEISIVLDPNAAQLALIGPQNEDYRSGDQMSDEDKIFILSIAHRSADEFSSLLRDLHFAICSFAVVKLSLLV